jgi:hypothetical protein
VSAIDIALAVEVDFANDGTWVDITDWMQSGSIERGATRHDGVYARAEAGMAHVILNNHDARFDPTNLDGPYVADGASQVRPRRPWRIIATLVVGGAFQPDAFQEDAFQVSEGAAAVVPIFRGFAEPGWRSMFALAGRDATVTLEGVDGTTVFANYDGREVSPIGAGETTGERIERVADLVGWPEDLRLIAEGLTRVQGTTLAQNARGELLLAADTELGEVYFDGAGRLVFRDRDAITDEFRSAVSQATFGDDADELPYVSIALADDATQVRNVVTISRAGGVAVTKSDEASIATYLTRGFQRTDLIHRTDGESLDYRDYILAVYGDTEPRFDSLTIDPLADPDTLWYQAIGRELGDRITVRLRPPGRATPIERDCIIRGISHTWTQTTWRTRWALQDTARLELGAGIMGQIRPGVYDDSAYDAARFQ